MWISYVCGFKPAETLCIYVIVYFHFPRLFKYTAQRVDDHIESVRVSGVPHRDDLWYKCIIMVIWVSWSSVMLINWPQGGSVVWLVPSTGPQTKKLQTSCLNSFYSCEGLDQSHELLIQVEQKEQMSRFVHVPLIQIHRSDTERLYYRLYAYQKFSKSMINTALYKHTWYTDSQLLFNCDMWKDYISLKNKK